MEIIDNNYYDSSGARENGTVSSSQTQDTFHTNHLDFEEENSNDYSSDPCFYSQSENATNYGVEYHTAGKPVIKPKPIIGPNGDVYTSVDKVNHPSRLPINTNDNHQYINSNQKYVNVNSRYKCS